MIPSPADTICSIAETLPKPESVGIFPPDHKGAEDQFMNTFKKLYARLPVTFKAKPLDQGVEIVKTRFILQALKELALDLKSKS
jgi:hypothetical protein